MKHLPLIVAGLLGIVTSAAAEPVIELDGEFDDWPEGVWAVADAEYLYIRVQTGEVTSLQNSRFTVNINIDADGDAETGLRLARYDPAVVWGADLSLSFSTGVTARLLARDGPVTPIAHSAYGVLFAPSHASDQFEIRLDRVPKGDLPQLGGNIVVAALAEDSRRLREVWNQGAVRLHPPELAPAPERLDIEVPARPDDAVRVLSWNVLWGSPMGNPEPFDRVLHALKPDVVLVQEWDDRNRDAPPVTEDELATWFNYSEDTPVWTAIKGGERGVAIISRHPMQRIETRTLRPDSAGDPKVDDSRGIRVAAARISTPVGDLVATSLHLKCCGGYAGEEDSQRLAEARAIRAALLQAMRADAPDMVVIAGDFNLVGDPAPQALLASGTDADGGDLVVADTPNLGQRVRVSWREQGSRFAPGRLDYALVGDAGARIANAFIFDASVLSDATLEAIGVQRDDTATSDHMPVVIDILPDAN
ncbi:MAG: endonuclease/exonuclease/phosphatase family protein [Phycisphaerales bacterium]